jgi:hypothetical protein
MFRNSDFIKFIGAQETWLIRFKYLAYFVILSTFKRVKYREVRKSEIQGAVSDDAYPLM